MLIIQEPTHDVIASIEGLDLSTDLVIYDSVIFGSGAEYQPIPGVTDFYIEAYKSFGFMPLNRMRRVSNSGEWLCADEDSLVSIDKLPHGRKMGDAACIAFPVRIDFDISQKTTERSNTQLLDWLLRLGDQIIDLLRLFLYRPGDDRLIGRVGGLGRGIHGLWLISRFDDEVHFIARQTSPLALVAEPVSMGLSVFQDWYSTDTFRELCSAACAHPEKQIPLYDKIFAAMRSFRESREVQSLEGRFRQLMPLIEDLANQHDSEHLKGDKLRRRIAQVAWYSLRDDWDEQLPLRWGQWLSIKDLEKEVSRLWSKVRNKLSHTCRVVESFSEDPIKDLITVEILAVSMIRALGRACFESGATETPIYSLILQSEPIELDESEGMDRQKLETEQPFPAKQDSLRDDAAIEAYGFSQTQSELEGRCVKCRSEKVTASDFRDSHGQNEFLISRLCQDCQDNIFGKP